MPQTTAENTEGWAPALRQRRKALLQRLVMGAASALVFSPLLGWTYSAVWVAGYFLIQLVDLWVFAPITSGRAVRIGRLRSAVGGVMLALNSLYFGSLSIALWLTGGPVGGVASAMLLCAGSIYSLINAPGSGKVLVLTTAPHLIYLATTPIMMIVFGAPSGFVTAVAVAVGVYGMFCISTWRKLNRAQEAEAEARLEANRKQAEAERILAGRSAFLAAVGHDLRTPIGAILTGAAELNRGDASARANAALITDAGLMMKALLDDLLDHAKLDAGRMQVEAADFDLRQMLSQTLRLWQGPIRDKGLRLRFEGARHVPRFVRGDVMRLRQVLNNLISNAAKFTAEGAITLRVRAWAEEPSGTALVVEVADTGPGMTVAQLARLFKPFDQTTDGVSAQFGGTGLGLAISHDLVELMGGRLTARSELGQGARFTFAIVLGRAESQAAPPASVEDGRGDVTRALAARALPNATRPEPVRAAVESAEPALQPDDDADDTDEDGRPLRALVVDDHDINRRAVQLILQPLGCDIATAADGLKALEICDTEPFDVIFMDVRMPELDGRETTRRLRAGGGLNATTPVVAVTADTSPDDIAACTAAGMDYFVSKPLTPAALIGALNQVLSDGAEAEAA